MKYLKTYLLIAFLLPILSFANDSHSNIADRGGGARGGSEHIERNEDGRFRNDGVYGGYESYGIPAVYPAGYGGYLYPEAVDPGEDEADAIYRANQHPGE